MINHFLLTLTPEQEDRLLVEMFEPYPTMHESRLGKLVGRCVVDVADGLGAGSSFGGSHARQAQACVGFRYDHLCRRFGVPRVNAAIRNRVLSNRARRELAQVQDEMYVGSML